MKCGSSKYAAIVGFIAVMLVAGGCAQTTRAPVAKDSGFLGADYALLKPGKPDQAQLVYFRPGVEWSRYRKILLDPVTGWEGKESAGRGISAQDEQMLVNYFDHRVGGKALDAAIMTSWGDVENMMRLWASHGTYNFCRMQNRANCIAPPPSR